MEMKPMQCKCVDVVVNYCLMKLIIFEKKQELTKKVLDGAGVASTSHEVLAVIKFQSILTHASQTSPVYITVFTCSNLEADDDLELLEKVKKDREKRLQRQGVISSLKKETGYLQELVYKLSKVGEAIEKNDLSSTGSVLAQNDWLKNVNLAFTKLSSSPEEQAEVDAFNSSFSSLISSVDKQEIDPAKTAFVSSASAFEKWVELTGLISQLKGL